MAFGIACRIFENMNAISLTPYGARVITWVSVIVNMHPKHC